MSQFFTIYPNNINMRLIHQAVAILKDGGIVVYPTDSCYALGCHLDDKHAVGRIREIRGLDDQHHLTLMCRDLSEISNYARVDNTQFRLLKANTPGSYTFILEATKEVPKRLQHPKKSTIGIRVPDHPVALALLEELGEKVDAVIDGGVAGADFTTVIDLTGSVPVLLRQGKGDVAPFGIKA
jgi:tRNA threonylcarbamoyl adenosine modification protein (Sua5/YciO/YrdC/YwlC family)